MAATIVKLSEHQLWLFYGEGVKFIKADDKSVRIYELIKYDCDLGYALKEENTNTILQRNFISYLYSSKLRIFLLLNKKRKYISPSWKISQCDLL